VIYFSYLLKYLYSISGSLSSNTLDAADFVSYILKFIVVKINCQYFDSCFGYIFLKTYKIVGMAMWLWCGTWRAVYNYYFVVRMWNGCNFEELSVLGYIPVDVAEHTKGCESQSVFVPLLFVYLLNYITKISMFLLSEPTDSRVCQETARSSKIFWF
jgi:hypothetical protein